MLFVNVGISCLLWSASPSLCFFQEYFCTMFLDIRNTTMRVLVTGASGSLGNFIVKLLVEDADEVRSVVCVDVRPFEEPEGFDRRGKELIIATCDIREISKMEKVFDGVECVIHSAAYVSIGHFPDGSGMKDVNETGTRIIVELCRRFNVPYLVYTSTADVMLADKGSLVNATESFVLPPPDMKFMIHPYALTKLRAENLVLGSDGLTLNDEKRVLRTLALRPVTLYGEGDRHFVLGSMKQAKAAGGSLTRMGPASAKFSAMYVGNAAWAHIVAMRAIRQRPGEVAGEAYVVTDDTPPSNIFDFVAPYFATKNLQVSDFMLPYYFVLSIAILFHYVIWSLSWIWVWKEPPIPPVNELRYCGHTYTFNDKKARQRLKYSPKFSLEESRERATRYYASVPL